MSPLIPLHRLAAGQKAVVNQLLGHAPQVHRLHELGFALGSEVQMIRSGSPCIVRLGGRDLCFRGGEILNVLVSPRVAS